MVDWKGGHQPLTQGRHISVILAEEKVGRREWRWQPNCRWERWSPAPYSRYAHLSNPAEEQSWAKLLRSLTVNSLSYFVKIKY